MKDLKVFILWDIKCGFFAGFNAACLFDRSVQKCTSLSKRAWRHVTVEPCRFQPVSQVLFYDDVWPIQLWVISATTTVPWVTCKCWWEVFFFLMTAHYFLSERYDPSPSPLFLYFLLFFAQHNLPHSACEKGSGLLYLQNFCAMISRWRKLLQSKPWARTSATMDIFSALSQHICKRSDCSRRVSSNHWAESRDDHVDSE